MAFSLLAAALGASAARAEEVAATIEMVRVPGGCYKMGTQGYEKHEQPIHNVCVSDFEIGKYEVTQAQWRAVMGVNPSKFAGCGDNCPVDKVSWLQAQEFVQKLSAQGKGMFRLPTEAEWEYACRSGGKDETWPGGVGASELGEVAWFNKAEAGKQTHPVGTKKANGLGLHDMAGNVWEWVQDKFVSPYPTAVENNPKIESGGEEKRVMRGGSWDGKAPYVRCGIRNRYDINFVDSDGRVGVRVLREIPR
ncbi:formylglycine-generating enzyme family protein [Ideonella azotifigens]|nr:formylglycine-generating enzyme family protein [Ideonella azotifigens]MCD2341058.1 formylglycine-generating enzyme family protein [Ideonella azotifigens]